MIVYILFTVTFDDSLKSNLILEQNKQLLVLNSQWLNSNNKLKSIPSIIIPI